MNPSFANSTRSLTTNLATFAELLRTSGCRVSLAEILDAGNALSCIDIFDRKTFYYALRTTLVKEESFFLRFEVLFRRFWSTEQEVLQPRENDFSQLKPKENIGQASFDLNDYHNNQNDEESARQLALYSSMERESYSRLTNIVAPEKLNQMKRLVRKFKRYVATIPGRRKKRAHRGEIDLHRSIRRAVSKSGSTIVLEKSQRKILRSKLVVLADISGSMQNQSQNIFLLLYLFKNVSRNSEIFVFSTRLLRLKNITSLSNLNDASRAISKQVSIWGSGTRIGESLTTFLTQYRSILDERSVVVIISDGWDLGDPEILRREMLKLRQRSAQIIWLNPLIKTAGYEPACIGMKTALDFVDIFATTDIFQDKGVFETYLGKGMTSTF